MKFDKNIKEFPISIRELRLHYIMALGDKVSSEISKRKGRNKLFKHI